MEDNEIVDLFLARDEMAIKRTSEKYGRKLLSLAYRVCREITTAEECENDTYLKAWDSIPPTHQGLICSRSLPKLHDVLP